MSPHPDNSDSDTAAKLAAWLAAHMARTRQSAADVARSLGVGSETVRSWLARAGHKLEFEDNEFDHLDTPAKLGVWLRGRVADSGRSVRQIAASTEGVSMSTIYNWLNGRHLPPPPKVNEVDRFDQLLRNPHLGLGMSQRVQLDEIRRRLTGTSLPGNAATGAWRARALPVGNRAFTGRRMVLRRLDRLLLPYTRGEVAISVLSGIGGVGKTALAVHWARSPQTKATFTDGCLYLDLNGFSDSEPVSPETARRRLLYQLGVDPREIPTDPEAQAARYRSEFADRRILLVLDNARAEPQVRSLLPGDPGCFVIVTSRSRLHGLNVTSGALAHVDLDVLGPDEAAALLRELLGRLATAGTTEEDVRALAEACGRLPLALQIAAADYLTHYHPRRVSVSDYTASLATNRLDRLSIGPTDPTTAIAATMDNSYRRLGVAARRAYRLLGLHPGPDLTASAAAGLLGLTVDAARPLLRELTQANLLDADRRGRYRFHDLVREHAAAAAEATDPEADRRDAVARMLDHHLHSASAAAKVLDPDRDPIELAPAHPGANPQALDDYKQATAWLDAERRVLLAMIEYAAANGHDTHAWQMTWAVTNYLHIQGLWHEQAATGRIALAAAGRLGDDDAMAWSHRFIAYAAIKFNDYDQARAHLCQALALHRGTGDLGGQASASHSLSYVEEQCGRYEEALAHSARALDLHRERGLRRGQARALNEIGWLHALLGDHAPALTSCAEALDHFEALGFRLGAAHCCDSLGYIHHRLGEPALALKHYRRALELFRELDRRFEQAGTLTRIGDTLQETGEAARAQAAWQEALDMFTELGHVDGEAVRAKLAALEPRT